jgi:hypothetical protein
MSREEFIKKKIRELKEKIPSIDEKQLEKELIPLEGKEVGIKVKKKNS